MDFDCYGVCSASLLPQYLDSSVRTTHPLDHIPIQHQYTPPYYSIREMLAAVLRSVQPEPQIIERIVLPVMHGYPKESSLPLYLPDGTRFEVYDYKNDEPVYVWHMGAAHRERITSRRYEILQVYPPDKYETYLILQQKIPEATAPLCTTTPPCVPA